MDSQDLSTDYDVIVVGTGLVESIYAAAAARVGKTVLHIDGRSYYSGEWAVVNFNGLQEWIAAQTEPEPEPTEREPEPGTVPLRCRRLVHGVVHRSYIEEGEPFEEANPLGLAAPFAGTVSGGGDSASGVPVPPSDSAAAEDSSEQSGKSANSEPAPDTTETTPAAEGPAAGEPTSSPSQPSAPSAESASPESSGPAGTDREPPEGSAPQPQEGAAAPDRAPAREDVWTVNRMKKLSRRFNIDLAPKVLYCRGALVELLISSNIARYAEFRAVGQLLTPLDGQLQPVPSSRADVFTSRQVSVVEKRLLMKLLNFCVDFEREPDQYRGYEEKPFREFLRSRRLTDNLTHHVIHAIAMVTPETPTLEALRSTQKFLRSLGRYGNTPFLWPMYGSGELPQCFCRMCAVFGGVYYLSRGVESLAVDDAGVCCGMVSQGQRFTCRRLLLEEAYRPRTGGGPAATVSRAILITDRSLYPPAGDQVLLIRLPAAEGEAGPVTVLQVGAAASAAPAGLYVVHLTCAGLRSAEEDLSPAVSRLQALAASSAAAGDDREAAPLLRVLSATYFSRESGGEAGEGQPLPENVAVCRGPDAEIGFEAAVKQARELFTSHFPEEDFLPRAPDPEEIIFFDESAESVVTGGARELAPEAGRQAGEAAEGGQLEEEVPSAGETAAAGQTEQKASSAGEAAEGGQPEEKASSVGEATAGVVGKGAGDGEKSASDAVVGSGETSAE